MNFDIFQPGILFLSYDFSISIWLMGEYSWPWNELLFVYTDSYDWPESSSNPYSKIINLRTPPQCPWEITWYQVNNIPIYQNFRIYVLDFTGVQDVFKY